MGRVVNDGPVSRLITGDRLRTERRDGVGQPPWRRRAIALAGPLAIVGAVLVVMHAVWLSGLLSYQHIDVLSMWLPTHCFLGKTLASGHVPAFDPHVMGGVPFAADPQSGWMYLPAMLLYASLPCATAIRWFVVLQPLLAGLGLYWFLRTEELSRVAATAGGLSLAMLIASSNVGLSLPFDATLAWTPFILVAASRYLRAASLPGRLGWLALGAFAWGQVGSAHMSHGLAMASLTVVV